MKPRPPQTILRNAAVQGISTVLFLEFAYGVTKRRNGYEVVGSKRDAVDTGDLLNSIRIVKTRVGFQIKFTANYAPVVFQQRPEIGRLITKIINYTELAAWTVDEEFRRAGVYNAQTKRKRLNKKRRKRKIKKRK